MSTATPSPSRSRTAGRNGEVRLHGTITNDLHALEKLIIKLRKAHPGARLEACYEAGPCGFGIARRSGS